MAPGLAIIGSNDVDRKDEKERKKGDSAEHSNCFVANFQAAFLGIYQRSNDGLGNWTTENIQKYIYCS